MSAPYIPPVPPAFRRARDFLAASQPGAEKPWNWFIDRINFTFSVSAAMRGATVADWERRLRLFARGGEPRALVIGEAEGRGEIFIQSGPEELGAGEIAEAFDFIEAACFDPLPPEEAANAGAGRGASREVVRLRIDPRWKAREEEARRRGFAPAGWTEPIALLDLEAAEDAPWPADFALVEGSAATPALKSACHSRAFGYPEDRDLVARNAAGFAALRAMPDYLPCLDLLALDPSGRPAAMMGFWYDAANRWGVLEPAGTDPAFQKRGLGRALVGEGIRRLRRLGARRLWVGSDQDFYLRCGFRVVNRWGVWEKRR